MMFAGKFRHLLPLLLITTCSFLIQACGDPPPEEKSPAPDFTLDLFDGGQWRLGDHKGHPVIINFFASWCVPCGEEAPLLENGYQEFRKKGVLFVGVATQDTESKAKGFVKKHGFTFPTGLDASGKIREAFGVYGLPTTFFIDQQGIISYLHIGGVTKDLIQYELEKIF